MIDIHSHLLVGVDDGCDTLAKSRELLIEAINEGISDVCLTPHFSRVDEYMCKVDVLKRRFEQLKEYCVDLKVNLYLGNELMIENDLDELLLANQVLSLNNSKYVLVEFPFDGYKSEYDEYLMNIALSGYKIIIAHPDRYPYSIDNPEKYIERKWINNGYYIQCNQNSLNDSKRRKLVFDLIENKQVHFICSDAHNKQRPLSLKNAYDVIAKKFNKEVSDILFERNARHVLNNENIESIPSVKRRLF